MGGLGGCEGVVIVRPDLVHSLIEGVAGRGLHLLGPEGVAGGAEASRLPGACSIGGDGREAVAVGRRIGAARVYAVDGARERVVGVGLRPALGCGLGHLHRGVVGERQDHLGGRARVEHEGLEARRHLARASEDLAPRGVVVNELAAVPEADDVPLHPVAEALGASEHGVVTVAGIGVGHEDVSEGHVAVGRHGAAAVPFARPQRLVEPGRTVGEPDVGRKLPGAPARCVESRLLVSPRLGRRLGGVATPRGLAVNLEPGRVIGVVLDSRADGERRALRRVRLGGGECERGQ